MTATRKPPGPPPAPPSPRDCPPRAITVHEPWAWLIVSDFAGAGRPVKSVENRTWPTSYRGPALIHASSSWSLIAHEQTAREIERHLRAIDSRIGAQLDLPAFAPDDGKGEFAPSMVWHPGHVLGAVEILGCVEFPPGADFRRLCAAAGFADWYERQPIPPAKWAQPGFCWLLDHPRQFTRPFPARGALNLWQTAPKPDIVRAAEACLRQPLGSPYHFRRAAHEARAKVAGK